MAKKLTPAEEAAVTAKVNAARAALDADREARQQESQGATFTFGGSIVAGDQHLHSGGTVNGDVRR
jgi:hypothetical protein